METAVTIGLDLAKSVFQVYGVNASGEVVVRRQLRRAKLLDFFAKIPRCLVGMEACAAAHYWGREIRKLGHDVRLMPPSYVKAYVKRQKNDAADAEAICEAVTRSSMRFVEIKSIEQQSVLVLHRVRQTLTRQRVQLSNAIRGHIRHNRSFIRQIVCRSETRSPLWARVANIRLNASPQPVRCGA